MNLSALFVAPLLPPFEVDFGVDVGPEAAAVAAAGVEAEVELEFEDPEVGSGQQAFGSAEQGSRQVFELASGVRWALEYQPETAEACAEAADQVAVAEAVLEVVLAAGPADLPSGSGGTRPAGSAAAAYWPCSEPSSAWAVLG